MPQSLSSLLTHLVFSTKNREQWLKGDVAAEIHPYLASIPTGAGRHSADHGEDLLERVAIILKTEMNHGADREAAVGGALAGCQ